MHPRHSKLEVEHNPIASAREALAALDLLRRFFGDIEGIKLAVLKYVGKVG